MQSYVCRECGATITEIFIHAPGCPVPSRERAEYHPLLIIHYGQEQIVEMRDAFFVEADIYEQKEPDNKC